MKPKIIRAWQLKVGDRFSEIPAAWHGPGTVTESYGRRVLYVEGPYLTHLPKVGMRRVDGMWTIKFANIKVVNPPGVLYVHPETKVRLLARRRAR